MPDDYPETPITFTVEVDGETVTEEFTTDDVSDPRAAWNPDVALAYAQHLAVDRHGYGVDVDTVEIQRLGEPDDNHDETGGVPV